MAGILIDLVHQCQNYNNIPPAVYTTSTQGSAADMSQAEISLNAIINVGAYSVNNTTTFVQIEECTTTNGTYAAITGMTCTVTASNQQFVLRGLRTLRYARANAITVAGTTPSVTLQACLVEQLKYVGGSTDLGGYSNAPSQSSSGQ